MKQEILNLYKNRFNYDKFYDNLFYNIQEWKSEHIQHQRFLYGYPFKKNKVVFEQQRPTETGNIRIDLPVWYGDINSEKRIVFIGLEPRDTDKRGYLNIEHKSNKVFATPFALERPWSRYQKAFSHLLDKNDTFFYFTDAVKEYLVADKDDKKLNDSIARKNFKLKTSETIDFLRTELNLIKPTMIITLGGETFRIVNKYLKDEFNIVGVIHPARNRHYKTKKQVDDILK